MEVLLDTNFIISCIRRKIDFISELEGIGFYAVLPREVMQEIKDLRKDASHADRIAANLALEMFESIKIKKTKLGNKSVDDGLIAKGKLGIYVATLDSSLKRIIPNKVIINNASNKIEVERS